ncbi:MAG: pyridoxal phosphate-dependent aminotransferase [Deltaproteobacteria bacterium]|nr:pyridoxal phosphate-dependent aminotransferase [Deltaproteobacteria bacterium]
MISKKAQRIKSFIAMDILERSQALELQGRSIIPFSLGEPDFDPPECVKEACIRAIRENRTKYTHSQGLLELREEICEHYLLKYGVTVHPDRIIVTEGTSPAFFLVFSTILERGDEVILPNPHYPCDANFIEFLDGKPVFFPIREKDGYQWNTRSVQKRISKKTRAVFVTSPSNPTGTVLEEEVMKKLASLDVPVVSDEIYHGLVYEGKEHSILEYTDDAFVVNGFSKAYAMTGFRLGYVIAPKEYIRAMQKIHQNFMISANSFVQYAGIAALKEAGRDLERMRNEFKRRREAMLSGLRGLGFKIGYNPEGAFYVLVDVRHLSKDSYKLAFDVLDKAHVAITPGIDFGSGGEGRLRFSYAVSVEKIEEGLHRLKNYLHA